MKTFFCSSPNFEQKIGLNLSEDLFFCSSPNFGQKIVLISGGTISYSVLFSNFLKFLAPPFQNPAYATVHNLALTNLKLRNKLILAMQFNSIFTAEHFYSLSQEYLRYL